MGTSQKTDGSVCDRQHPVSGGAKEKERIEMSYQYLLTLCLILASTKVLSIATGRLQLPQVVGSLLAGLLLGPAVFGIIQPNDLLNQLAELGVIVIMFSAGMGTNIQDLKASGKSGFLVALCGVLALRSARRARKNGGCAGCSGCGGSCGGCTGKKE